MLPWLSPLWLVLPKIMQFGIFVFAEVQETLFPGNLLASKCDGDYHRNITSLKCNFTKNACKFAIKRDSRRLLKFPKE